MNKKQKKNSKKIIKHQPKYRKFLWLSLFATVLFCTLAIALKIVLDKVQRDNATKQDIALLDQAEATMRSLDFPKADTTTYERSCSVRSVKFSEAGLPNCDITRRDVFFNMDFASGVANGMDYFKIIKSSYGITSDSEVFDVTSLQHHMQDSSDNLATINYFLQKGLTCYTSLGIEDQETINRVVKKNIALKESSNLLVSTSCYKEFLTRVYSVE